MYKDVIIVNTILDRQKVFQSAVAPLYVIEQSFSLIHSQCVGHFLQFEFDVIIGPQHCAACSMRNGITLLIDEKKLVRKH